MKVNLFGHSYVRDLSCYGLWGRELELVNGEKVSVHFEFKTYPGKDYAYFLDHSEEVSKVTGVDPDVIIDVLGGNSGTGSLSSTQIKEKAAAFYTLPKEAARPHCIKLAMQVEPRFLKAENSYGVPEAPKFNQRRQIVNDFMNKK